MSNIQNILDVFITKMNCFTKISVQQLTSCFIKLTQFPVPDRRVILNTNLIELSLLLNRIAMTDIVAGKNLLI